MTQFLERVLQAARRLGASDVHLKVGLPPVLRIRGELRSVRDVPPLTQEALEAFALGILSERQRSLLARDADVDVGFTAPDGGRTRVNIFHQRGQLAAALRLIPPEVPAFETLNLPASILRFADLQRGLVLVTGTTGSGKSTTLAALVEHVNAHRACHIVTVEDPIEYWFRERKSIVNQREVGLDTVSFARALRAALRQDPDVILVGELRDLETIEIALTAAETGHLVFSTLHTMDAVETVNRMVGVFPSHQQPQVRLQLAAVLAGVVSQRLVAKADGTGMVPAVEVLVATARVRELVASATRTREIRAAIAEGREPYGMVSFDQSLTDLVARGLVAREEALKNASSPTDFALRDGGISTAAETPAWVEPTAVAARVPQPRPGNAAGTKPAPDAARPAAPRPRPAAAGAPAEPPAAAERPAPRKG